MSATDDLHGATLAALLSPLGGSSRVPAVVDAHALRHLCLQSSAGSLPPWARSVAWQALLSYLPPEKDQWGTHLTKRRSEYYKFIQDFLPLADDGPQSPPGIGVPGTLSERDVLLDSIFNDINHSLATTPGSVFHDPIPPSASNPLSPLPEGPLDAESTIDPRLSCRWLLLRRLGKIYPSFMTDFAGGPAPGGETDSAPSDEERFGDVRWHSLLRILYLFALLNPSIGYIQGMHDAATVFLFVFGQNLASIDLPDRLDELEFDSHVEADAFWCFSALMSEVRDLFDFDGIDHTAAGLHISNTRGQADTAASKENEGIAGALKQLSVRLQWLDQDLWDLLCSLSLDPRAPLYSFRWLISLLSTELHPGTTALVWDKLLTETGTRNPRLLSHDSTSKIDFLIDASCAMLVTIREDIFKAARPREGDHERRDNPYRRVIVMLLNYPQRTNMADVLSLALSYRLRRITSSLTGDAPRTMPEPPRTPIKGPRSSLLDNLGLSPAVKSWLPSNANDNLPPRAGTNGNASPSPGSNSVLSRYATQFSSNDTVSNLSRKGSVWAAKALKTWNQATLPPTASADPPNSPPNGSDPYTISRNGTIKPIHKAGQSEQETRHGRPNGPQSSPSLSARSADDSPAASGRRSLLLVDRSPSPSHSSRLSQTGLEPEAAGDVSASSATSALSSTSVASSLEGMIAAVRRKHNTVSAPPPPRAPPKQLILSGAKTRSATNSISSSGQDSPALSRSRFSPPQSQMGSPSLSPRGQATHAHVHARGESNSTFSSLASLEEESRHSRRDSILSNGSSRASDRLGNRRATLGYRTGPTSGLNRTTSLSRRVSRPSSIGYNRSPAQRHNAGTPSLSDNTIATFLQADASEDAPEQTQQTAMSATGTSPLPALALHPPPIQEATTPVSPPTDEQVEPSLSRNDTIRPKPSCLARTGTVTATGRTHQSSDPTQSQFQTSPSPSSPPLLNHSYHAPTERNIPLQPPRGTVVSSTSPSPSASPPASSSPSPSRTPSCNFSHSSDEPISEDAILAQLNQADQEDDYDAAHSSGEEDMLFTNQAVTSLSHRLSRV